MSAALGQPPLPVATWDMNVDPGDPADIFGCRYIFERVDPDHVVTFRPESSSVGDFMIEGVNGLPRKPTVDEVNMLIASDDLIWRDKPLSNEARRFARAKELCAAQARAMDAKSQFRMAIVRRFDASPWSKSDAGLTAFMKHAMQDPKISALQGAWPASPATVRTWLNERGTKGCRKEQDGISMTNRMPKLRKIGHPLEILFYHAVRATNVRGSITMNYVNYLAEIAKINAGIALNREFWIETHDEASS